MPGSSLLLRVDVSVAQSSSLAKRAKSEIAARTYAVGVIDSVVAAASTLVAISGFALFSQARKSPAPSRAAASRSPSIGISRPRLR